MKKICNYNEFKRAITRNYFKLFCINYCNGVWFFNTKKCVFVYKPSDQCEEFVFMHFCKKNSLKLKKKRV